VILDQSFGCRPDALFLLFSAGKPFIAMLVHLLAERGLVNLDDRVARYWPEFASTASVWSRSGRCCSTAPASRWHAA
jgi:CubicO group peptidase (beta-lactamase class C family)